MKFKLLFVTLLCLISLTSRSQTIFIKGLNDFYKKSVWFGKTISDFSNLEKKGELGQLKIFSLANENEYYGNIKLSSKPIYLFLGDSLYQVQLSLDFGNLKDNSAIIEKMFGNPNETAIIRPTGPLALKEGGPFGRNRWIGNYMIVEVTDSKILFTDKKLDAKRKIINFDYWQDLERKNE